MRVVGSLPQPARDRIYTASCQSPLHTVVDRSCEDTSMGPLLLSQSQPKRILYGDPLELNLYTTLIGVGLATLRLLLTYLTLFPNPPPYPTVTIRQSGM